MRARALPAPSLEHFDLAYDGLLRLTEVAGPVAEGFSLDAASNIASRTGPLQTNSYDGAGRLLSDGARALGRGQKEVTNNGSAIPHRRSSEPAEKWPR